jgi:Right handed beta helix region
MRRKKKMRLTNIFIIAIITAAAAIAGSAQMHNTFVASTGSDNTDCGSRELPCRDFNYALTKTDTGGIVTALDSGIYALTNVSIDKSVTLVAAPGVQAEMFNTDVNDRIRINATGGALVILRNLYIAGDTGGTNAYGIGVYSVGKLQVENCVIDRFSEGIGTGLQAGAEFFIRDTIIKNSLSNGTTLTTTSGLLRVTIDHCQFVRNGTSGTGHGVNALRKTKVDIRESIASANAGVGFIVTDGDMTLDACTASNNAVGVEVQPFGKVIVSNSFVTNNSHYGFQQAQGGTFNSLGNNTVRNNSTANTTGTINVVPGT